MATGTKPNLHLLGKSFTSEMRSACTLIAGRTDKTEETGKREIWFVGGNFPFGYCYATPPPRPLPVSSMHHSDRAKFAHGRFSFE